MTATIRTAVFEELAGTGYARMSMEAVARRAGVGKAALYRRWASKEEMLVGLVSAEMRDEHPEPVDTGSLQGDVAAFVAATADLLGRPHIRRILPDLLAEAQRSRALADAMCTALLAPRRAAVDAILRRATTRGELPVDLDHDLATDLLGAPLVFRILITDGPLDPGYRSRLTRSLVAALATAH
ncbi:AcrR family transcriptional regulator [Nocardiopsis mwathae]|uniref:AcrR family transcriptional regulator n=1 Tax=Nocardiopsis mwathae TaxID=1472723 RepID=A0A7W9YLU8_9ACTN|nr:AcrR family transcriptional regulator [Nocardiopsis mwathae]